jgi:hypothetical protein
MEAVCPYKTSADFHRTKRPSRRCQFNMILPSTRRSPNTNPIRARPALPFCQFQPNIWWRELYVIISIHFLLSLLDSARLTNNSFSTLDRCPLLQEILYWMELKYHHCQTILATVQISNSRSEFRKVHILPLKNLWRSTHIKDASRIWVTAWRGVLEINIHSASHKILRLLWKP